MPEVAQRILVIQDASRDVSPGAIRAALQGFSLKPGDVVTILGVLHHVTNPMGYKIKVDKTNSKIIQEELDRKQEEYLKNEEIKEISEHYKTEKIDFHLEVQAGACPKRVALLAAKSLEATWAILDRQRKQYKKYFMEMLSCSMSSMKRNNSIQLLRAPQAIGNSKVSNESSTMSLVPYNEMVQGSPDEEQSSYKSPSDQKTSLDKGQFSDGCQPCSQWTSTSDSKSSPSEQLMPTGVSTLGKSEASSSVLTEEKCSPIQFQEEGNTTNTEQEAAGEQSPLSTINNQEIGPKEAFNAGSKMEEEYPEYLCSICKNRRPKIEWKRDFTYLELTSATQGFAKKNFLSEGGLGSVYSGEVDGLKIAVKQHKNASFQGEKEFKAEIHVLSKVRHKNPVRILGSCSEGSRRLLVYEYVCNGSLDQHLSKHSRKPLSWEKRIRIASGAAKGLQYLHENQFIHRDMRPNNILITQDYEALLGDFGLARPQNEDPDKSSETRVVGTLGYLAPEYAECGKVSTKTDVYAFGVVLLQLITGMRTTDKRLEGRSLVGWARPLLKEKNYPRLIDQRIMDSHDVHQLFWMVRMAEKCLTTDPAA